MISMFVEATRVATASAAAGRFSSDSRPPASPRPRRWTSHSGTPSRGASSILGAINIHHHDLQHARAGHDLAPMPCSSGSILVTCLILLAMPVSRRRHHYAADHRNFGTTFFARKQRRPILVPAFFWFFVTRKLHFDPAELRMVSHIVSTFSKNRCSVIWLAYRWSRSASSLVVCAHHMYAVGLNVNTKAYFVAATMVIACRPASRSSPGSRHVAARSSSRRRCSGRSAFIFLFTPRRRHRLGATPASMSPLHDTFTSSRTSTTCSRSCRLPPSSADSYFWIGKMSGYMYNEFLGKLHFWYLHRASTSVFFRRLLPGLAGMPRRCTSTILSLRLLNACRRSLSLLDAGHVIFLFMLGRTLHHEAKCADNPGASGPPPRVGPLPSRPPFHQFNDCPGSGSR